MNLVDGWMPISEVRVHPQEGMGNGGEVEVEAETETREIEETEEETEIGTTGEVAEGETTEGEMTEDGVEMVEMVEREVEMVEMVETGVGKVRMVEVHLVHVLVFLNTVTNSHAVERVPTTVGAVETVEGEKVGSTGM